ncbi:unnamed protein product [marine sediment metagenome]|uniref:Uncharacterized protein n=1 Tax=marine sediment metagenome TaxID=412755 RepID=X1JRU1_9ZZZZ
MFGTEEQQKRMLEAVDRRNESIKSFRRGMQKFDERIELFGRSFDEGLQKLGEHADGLLKLITLPEFLKAIGMKNHEMRRVQGKIGRIKL